RLVSDVGLMSEEVSGKILNDFNPHIKDSLDDGVLLINRIDDAVESHPHRVAVQVGEKTLSYGELGRRASRLANYLRKKGVRENDFVAICLNRSFDFVAATLAVTKIGAAYVPIDTRYPMERISRMIGELQPRVVLVNDGCEQLSETWSTPLVQ